MTSNLVLSNVEYSVVGTRPIRHDGVDKVTGKARYAADVQLPRRPGRQGAAQPPRPRRYQVHRHVAGRGAPRSAGGGHFQGPGPGSRQAGRGWRGRRTQPEVHQQQRAGRGQGAIQGGTPWPPWPQRTPHEAEEALKLIKVDYEVLPPVTTAEEAMKPGASILHDHMKAAALEGKDAEKTNVAAYQRLKQGGYRGRVQGGRRGGGARVSHQDGTPGIYRAAKRIGVLESRRQGDHLEQLPESFRYPGQYRPHPGVSRPPG